MAIDIESLQKAINIFNTVIEKSSNIEIISHLDQETREVVISGAVRHFEFTFDSCVEYMKQWLDQNAAGIPAGSLRKDLFDIAQAHHLIDDAAKWKEFQQVRSNTIHPHDIKSDAEIYIVVRQFPVYANRFFKVVDFRQHNKQK